MRILIVDDEKQMIEILRRYLNPMASLIESSEELPEALEMAKGGNFNVVVLDLKLRLTGKEEALEAIHVFKHYNCAVVVVSGMPNIDTFDLKTGLPVPSLKDEVMAAGASGFVPKDGTFGSRAMLIATNIATLNLPRGSYQSDSYLAHVDLLHKMVTEL